MSEVQFEGPEGDLDVYLSKAAYEQLPTVKGWKLDPELSGVNRSVYTKDGKAKVAYRGTDLTNPKTRFADLGTDVLVGLGLQGLSSRVKNAKRTAELTAQKYGRENTSLTGHSLGGTQAAQVSRATGLPATGFNTGWGLLNTLQKRTYPKFENYTVEGDVVGGVGKSVKGLKTTSIKPRFKNKHSLLNWI